MPMMARVEWTSPAESLSRGDAEREGGGGLPTEREDIVVYTRIWKEDLKSSRTPKIMSARDRLCADWN